MGTDGSISQENKKPYYMANIINAGFILSFGSDDYSLPILGGYSFFIVLIHPQGGTII